MPLFNEPKSYPPVADFKHLDSPEAPEGSSLWAAARLDNTVGSAIVSEARGLSSVRSDSDMGYYSQFGAMPDPQFNAWNEIEGTDYENHFDAFLGVRSAAEATAIKRDIDRETRDRRIVEDAGGWGVASQLVAGFVDLPTLVPGAGAVRGGFKAASVSRNALRTASLAASEAAAVEAALQQMQATRTGEESAVAIGGSAVLGLILGGGVSALMGAKDFTGEQAVSSFSRQKGERDLSDLDVRLQELEPRDLSAAVARDVKLSESEMALPTRAARFAQQAAPSGLSFTDTFRNARVTSAKQLGAELLTDPYSYQGKGRLGPAAETAFDVLHDRTAIAHRRAVNEGFKDYLKAQGTTNLARVAGRAGPVLDPSAFAEQVAAAMRRGDSSEIAEVRQVAARLRAEVLEPLRARAVRAGILDEDAVQTTATSYFPRIWDKRRIEARQEEFIARLAAKFGKDARDARARGDDGFDLSDMELDDYARFDAEDTYKTLTEGDIESDPFKGVTVKARGPLKERTLNVRDVDFEDFLVNDLDYTLARYTRVMSADISLAERFGDVSLKDQLAKVRDDYRKAIGAAKSEADAKKISSERDRVLERLEAARDIMRGTYNVGEMANIPYRVIQSAMAYNFIRLLGDVVASSLADVVRPTMAHGFKAVAGGAIVPLIKNLKKTRLTAMQAKEGAGVAESVLASRLMRIADIADPYSHRTPLENTIQAMSHVAGRTTGMLLWNDAMKSIAALTFTHRLRRLGTSKADARFLDRVGVSQDLAGRIKAQMAVHGQTEGSAFDPHFSRWEDAEARQTYLQAMRADMDTVIVTPGIGDKVPVAEHHYWLKPALQFKSFTLAAHRRVMIAGLQEDQTRFMLNAVSMMAMGMFVYYLKSLSATREPSDNVGVWVAEGIDRAGIIPLYMELSNMAESVGAPGAYYVLGNLLGEDPERASRYASRNVSGALAGPTAGLLADLKNLAFSGLTGLTDGEPGIGSGVTPGTVGSAKRVLPFGNHPGIKQYLNLWLVPELQDKVQ